MPNELVTWQDALVTIAELAAAQPTEPLASAADRFVAADISMQRAQPPFDRARWMVTPWAAPTVTPLQ